MHNPADQNSIKKVIELATPISRVWKALTDHEEFGAWFRVRLDGPFVVGKTTTGNIAYPGHEPMEWVSVTEVLEPEQRFVFSWPPSAVDPDGRVLTLRRRSWWSFGWNRLGRELA